LSQSASEEAAIYRKRKTAIEDRQDFGSFYEGGPERLTIREACNKIIHAEDVRPTDEDDSDTETGKQFWHMTSVIELTGAHGERVGKSY
jgi:hypothetical protein